MASDYCLQPMRMPTLSLATGFDDGFESLPGVGFTLAVLAHLVTEKIESHPSRVRD